MSWLSIPLPNPFKSLQFDDGDDDDDDNDNEEEPKNDAVSGVKEEFTAIGESIGRQFRAFITPETSNSGDNGAHSSRTFEGIRSDLEEIKGTFKSSLSLFSSNMGVSEISKLASNFLQLNDQDNDVINKNHNNRNLNDVDNFEEDEDEDEDDEYYVGINDEVVEFVNQISNRSELWTEFPLSLDHHEFDMSEVQYEHAKTIEQLVPSLADLRSQIGSEKSENQFWMIYFILLLPRLNEDDLELLSTPEIVEARETLLTMLRAKKSEVIHSDNPQSDGSSGLDNEDQCAENVMPSENSNASKTIECSDSNNSKKALEAEEGRSFTSSNDPNPSDAKPANSNAGRVAEEHGKIDNPEEEKSVTIRTSDAGPKKFQSEDDVSFSDLEDDDNDVSNRQSGSGPSRLTGTSSPEGSNDWVKLNKNVEVRGNEVKSQSSLRERDSEGEDSTGWLTVDDFDP